MSLLCLQDPESVCRLSRFLTSPTSLEDQDSTKHSGDKTWDNCKDDVDQAITALEDFLGVLRQHEPESVPADVACTELVATFHSVVDQAANHDSSKPCSRKSMA